MTILKRLSAAEWVASRYEVSYRYETLSFKHYLIATPLDDRLEWLKRAEGKGWPAAELAKQIRLSKILPPSFDGALPTISHADYRDWTLGRCRWGLPLEPSLS